MALDNKLLDKENLDNILNVLNEIDERLNDKYKFPRFALHVTPEAMEVSFRLDGIAYEAKRVYDSYIMTYLATTQNRDNNYFVNSSVGDFAMAIKNLAENLSFLMQVFYRQSPDDKLDLRNLQKNTKSAPLMQNGKTLYETFVSVHNPTDDNPLIKLRNNAGHNRGHSNVIQTYKTSFSCGYNIHANGFQDVLIFLDKNISKYFNMVYACLKTIADSDTNNLKPKL